MLFNDRILFIHVPKTGGMSITRFLIANLPGPFTISLPRGHAPPSPTIETIEGKRHEKLAEAAKLLERFGRKLDDFETIVAVVRNPYDLEVSYYHYKRLGYKYDAGRAQNLAMAGDFASFARSAPFYGRLPARIEQWYEIESTIPSNLRILRFETLETELTRLVTQFSQVKQSLGRENATSHESFERYLTTEIEQSIYEKYRWLFDKNFYERVSVAQSDGPLHSADLAESAR